MATTRSTVRLIAAVIILLLGAVAVVAVSWVRYHEPTPGHVLDEALAAGRPAESFPAADEDYFRDMDDGTALTTAEVRGRNTWIVWSGGNDWFWDAMTLKSAGAVDFLKVVSSHASTKGKRSNRFRNASS